MNQFYCEMKSKFLILMLILFAGFGNVQAQSLTVSGTVSSSSGELLPGVTVFEKNTTNGSITNIEGVYSIVISPDAILQVSFIGYETLEIPVNKRSNIDIVLSEDMVGLDEVIVIGYGSVKKKDATGAVAVVTEKDFQKGFVKSPAQLIANKVPGVQITSSAGAGPGTTIRIRGGSSLNASNDPLIVIDGVPTQSADALNKINPNDIASFNVLKDASATAIYGSRGSNGVILVTTKRGSASDLKFDFFSHRYHLN